MGVRYFFRGRLWGEKRTGFLVFPWGEEEEEEAGTSLPKHISLSDG